MQLHKTKAITFATGPVPCVQWGNKPVIIGDIAIFTADRSNAGTALNVLNLRSDVPNAQRFRQLHFPFDAEDFFVSASKGWIILTEGRKLHFRSLTTGDTPAEIEALGRGDLPVAEADLPDPIDFFDSISIWEEWLLISMICGEDSQRLRQLYHWPTGRKAAVSEVMTLYCSASHH